MGICKLYLIRTRLLPQHITCFASNLETWKFQF